MYESINTLNIIERARDYEAFINQQLGEKTEVSSEQIESLKQRAATLFPELRPIPNGSHQPRPAAEMGVFNNVLDLMMSKMGFSKKENDKLTPLRLRERFNPDLVENFYQ